MEQKPEETGKLIDVLRDLPDPLHFELPHTHKKLLELVYVCIIIGTIVLILLFNSMGVLTSDQMNAGVILVMIMAVILALMLVEKSSITQKPEKSSS
jgi:hypothetical protein